MSEARVRRAGLRDAIGVARVHEQTWHDTYRDLMQPEDLARRQSDYWLPRWERALSDASPQDVFVAESAREIVGFCSAGPTHESIENHDAELATLYLLRDWQGRGLGSKLVRTAASRIAQRGFRSMLVWVKANNGLARDFYERLGAVYLLTQREEQHGEVAVYVWKDLKELIG
ncbi:MAG: GNAT family N-acetyltransferase [Vulcanimicrobiaceae bacterium]